MSVKFKRYTVKAAQNALSQLDTSSYDKYTGFSNVDPNTDPYQTILSNTGSSYKTKTNSGFKLITVPQITSDTGIPLDANFFRNKDTDTILKELQVAGIQAPDNPLETVKPQKDAWWQRVLNGLGSIGNASTTGIYNLIDGDRNTGYFQGLGQGFKSSFNGQGSNIKSGQDILQSIANQNNWKGTGNKYIDGAGKLVGGLAVDILADPTSFLDLPIGSILKGSKVARGAATHLDDVTKVVGETADIAKSIDPAFDAAKRAESLLNQVNDFNNIAREGKGGITYGIGKFKKQLIPEQVVRNLSDKLGISTAYSGIMGGANKLLHSNPLTGGITDTVGKLGTEIQKKFTPYEMRKIAKESPEMAARYINSQTLLRQLGNVKIEDKQKIFDAALDLKNSLGTEDKSKTLTDLIENLQTGYSEAKDTHFAEIKQKTSEELNKRLNTLNSAKDRIIEDSTHTNPEKIALEEQIDKIGKLQELLNKQDINPIEKTVDFTDINKARANQYKNETEEFNNINTTLNPNKYNNVYAQINDLQNANPNFNIKSKSNINPEELKTKWKNAAYIVNENGTRSINLDAKTAERVKKVKFEEDGKLGHKAYDLANDFFYGKESRVVDEQNFERIYNDMKEGYKYAAKTYGYDLANTMDSSKIQAIAKDMNPATSPRFKAQRDIRSIYEAQYKDIIKDGKPIKQWEDAKKDLLTLRKYDFGKKEGVREAYKTYKKQIISEKKIPQNLKNILMDKLSKEIDTLPQVDSIYDMYVNDIKRQFGMEDLKITDANVGDSYIRRENVLEGFDNTVKDQPIDTSYDVKIDAEHPMDKGKNHNTADEISNLKNDKLAKQVADESADATVNNLYNKTKYESIHKALYGEKPFNYNELGTFDKAVLDKVYNTNEDIKHYVDRQLDSTMADIVKKGSISTGSGKAMYKNRPNDIISELQNLILNATSGKDAKSILEKLPKSTMKSDLYSYLKNNHINITTLAETYKTPEQLKQVLTDAMKNSAKDGAAKVLNTTVKTDNDFIDFLNNTIKEADKAKVENAFKLDDNLIKTETKIGARKPRTPKVLENVVKETPKTNSSFLDGIKDITPTMKQEAERQIGKYTTSEYKAFKDMQGKPLIKGSQAYNEFSELLKKAGVDDVYKNVDKMYVGEENIGKWNKTLNDIINSDSSTKISLDKAGRSMPEVIKNVDKTVKLKNGITQMKDYFPEEYDTLMNTLKEGGDIDLSKVDASEKIKEVIGQRLEQKRTMLQKVEPMIMDNSKSLEQITNQIYEVMNNKDVLESNFKEIYHKLYPEDPYWNSIPNKEGIVKKTVDERVKELPNEYKEAGRKFMTSMDDWMKSEEFWGVLDKERENYVPHIPTMEARSVEGTAMSEADTPIQKIINDKLNLSDPNNPHNIARTQQGTIKQINENTAKNTTKEALWGNYAEDILDKSEKESGKVLSKAERTDLKKGIINSMEDYHVKQSLENDAVKLFLERGLKHSQMLYDARYNDIMLKSFGVKMNVKEIDGKIVKQVTDLTDSLKGEELSEMLTDYKFLNNTVFRYEKGKGYGHTGLNDYKQAKEALNKIYDKFKSGQMSQETLAKIFEKGKEGEYGFYNGFGMDYLKYHEAKYSGGYNADPLKAKVNSALGKTKGVTIDESLPRFIKQQIKNSTVETPSTQMLKKVGTGEYVLVYPQGISKEQDISKLKDSAIPNILNNKIESNQITDIYGNVTPQTIVQVDLDQIEKLKIQNFDVPMYAIPKGAYEQIKAVTEDQMKRDKNAFLSLYDKFANVWKANATLSTGFHVRNAYSNTLQNFFAVGTKVFDPKIHKQAIEILRGSDKPITILGKEIPAAEFRKIATLNGVLGTEQLDNELLDVQKNISKVGFSKAVFNKLPQEAQQSILNKLDVKSALKDVKLSDRLNPLNIRDNALYNASRKVGNTIEDEAKLVNYIANLENGLSAEEAADSVRKFLFDYSDLTPFERDVMKRIVPFYTWMRKNIPLQLDNLMNRQSVFKIADKVTKNLNQPMDEKDKQFLPEFTKGYINLGKTKDGKYKLMNPNFPWQDLQKVTDVKEMASSINPLVKLILEESFNKNMYFDTPIDSGSGSLTEAPWFIGKGDNPILKALGGGANAKTGKTMLPAKLNYALTSLLPSLRTLGSYADGIKSNDYSKIAGLNTYKFDIDRTKNTAQNDYLKELESLQMKLKSLGIDISEISKSQEETTTRKSNAKFPKSKTSFKKITIK